MNDSLACGPRKPLNMINSCVLTKHHPSSKNSNINYDDIKIFSMNLMENRWFLDIERKTSRGIYISREIFQVSWEKRESETCVIYISAFSIRKSRNSRVLDPHLLWKKKKKIIYRRKIKPRRDELTRRKKVNFIFRSQRVLEKNVSLSFLSAHQGYAGTDLRLNGPWRRWTTRKGWNRINTAPCSTWDKFFTLPRVRNCSWEFERRAWGKLKIFFRI